MIAYKISKITYTIYILFIFLACSSSGHPSFLKRNYNHDNLLDNSIPSVNEQNTKFKKAKKKLEKWLKKNVKKKYYSSIAVGIVVGNKLVYDYHLNSKVNALYGIASVTKIFTSLAVMQQLEEGKFSLDDPINKYFPYLHIARAILKSKAVTIRNLLNHTSGIPDVRYYKNPNWISGKTTGLPFSIPEQVYPAGIHYRYSNFGFMILGELVAKVSGMSYREYLNKRILKPLKMHDTRLRKNLSGAYGVKVSLRDLAKFASLWLNKGETPDGEELIEEDTIALMTEPPLNNPGIDSFFYVGLGWRIKQNKEGVITMFHIGGAAYTMSWLELFPHSRAAIMYLGNPPEISDKVMTSIMRLQYKLAYLTALSIGKKKALNLFTPELAHTALYPKIVGSYYDPLHKKKFKIILTKKDKQIVLIRTKRKKEKKYNLESFSARMFRTKKEYIKYDFNFSKLGKVEGASTVNGYYFKIK